MIEFATLVVLAVFFIAGYESRSYVGALIPGAVAVFALASSLHSTPTGDEVDVLDAVFLAASLLGVLVYLAGVAIGRRVRRGSADTA